MSYVNQSLQKKDAMALVTGQPVYTDDLAPKECLIIKILRSPYANAWVEEIKTDTAMKVEGMPRHASTHAAGVVITHDPVVSYVPLARNDEAIVTQFTMTTLEELGLLKMDFLGLRTLTVIRNAEKAIRNTDPSFSIENIDMEDRQVFDMLCAGQTEGVFQFESAGMRSVLSQLKPESVEDLIAVISLYRPGPMDSIPTYIENRHNPAKIKYKTPKLKSILDVTYGCIVYQEQVMQICRELAGYSYGRADIVRRAMSKKKHDVMLRERDSFVNGAVDENGNILCEGAVRRGVPAEAAKAPTQEKKKAARGLFLRFDTASSPQIEYCRKLLNIFDGAVPLYYYFADTKEYKRNPIGQNIDVNDVLLRELRKILGESNVIFNE